MKTNTKQVTVLILLAIVLLIISFFTIRYYALGQSKNVVQELTTAIDRQETLLTNLTDSRIDSADVVTQRIFIDCEAASRQRFDVLLDSLSKTITASELSELEGLFYKCGDFFADRKSVIAIRLGREVALLSEYILLRQSLSITAPDYTKKLKAWEAIAEAELKTAEYFNKLVALQGTIITQLRSGVNTTAPLMVATLSEVNTVRGQMTVLRNQIEVSKTEALAI